MLTSKTAKAYAILAIIIDKFSAERFPEIDVEPYLNGRENGFAIKRWHNTRQAVFSESRNSNEIVLFTGRTTDFSMQGNTPNEEGNWTRVYFEPDAYVKAADAVIAFLFAPG